MATRIYEVRCAGFPVETREHEAPTSYDLLPSCGWQGKRRRKVRHGRPVVGTDPLTKPCPDCGGAVERRTV
jgi:hypothetical protein